MNPPEHSNQLPFAAAAAGPVGPHGPRPDLLDGLNDAQREAVTHSGGPLLVLAGAGSGKTRVITQRIAHLILDLGVPASRVIAVTFTNKAASEMRERVEALVGEQHRGGWLGTFHGMCLRILRRDGERVGLAPGFNVYDRDDQLAVVKRILKDDDIDDEEGTPPRKFLARISRAKNSLESPEEAMGHAHTPQRQLEARVYELYEQALRKANAADFDDLLLRTVELFRDPAHRELAQAYSSRCEHLLVDEYQDTNRPQYLLVRGLSAVHGNVCVVGDEDQCIYRFRGAELRNILEFESDHPGTRTIRLEQNYRSTSTILEAAGALIHNNMYRKGKRLWTENPKGDKIELFRAPDDRTEAAWVAQRCRGLSTSTPFDRMAVLYRTNAQSRQLEEVLRRERIPFQIVGSLQFYERKEIKDLLAYLRLAVNPADDVAFRRVVNTPARGIGATTVAALDRIATTRDLSMLEAARHAAEERLLGSRPTRLLAGFVELIEEMGRRTEDEVAAALIEHVVKTIDYEAYLTKTYGVLATERMENVRGLISAAVEFAEEGDSATLEGFLDRSALVADTDEIGQAPGITLMTVHCAKGLEFPIVFLVGLEERLFPHGMAGEKPEDVEEERRLCYVAMTRARERLLLAHARFRRLQGAFLPARASRFLDEIPKELLDERSAGGEGFFDPWKVESTDASYATGSSAARAARTKSPAAPTRTAPPGPAPADGYAVGSFVQHPRFGGGRVVAREGQDRNLKLTIHFVHYGPKKILPAYTRLEVQKG